MGKPNIVYILADQLRYSSCGFNGDNLASTPNLDRFAKRSTNLCNAVSGTPVCSAYRASLFTGKYTSSTGMVINELRINPNQHTPLAGILTDHGWQTAYIGKWHLWANELGNHSAPKNSFVPRGLYRLGFDGLWEAYNFHHEYYNGYYHTESPDKHMYEAFEPDCQTDSAVNFIQDADEDNPFFLFLSYGTPHDPWSRDNVPEQYFNKFGNINFPLPENYSNELDPYGDAWSNIDKTAEDICNWKRVYYAMVTNLDYNIGRILSALQEKKLFDDTIIIFTSDHGEMFGAHGRMKKNIFYDEAIRIPFLISWPNGDIPANNSCDVCLNTVDIMPTLLGLCRLSVPEDVEGFDLSNVLLGDYCKEPEAAFLQNTGACADWQNGHEWRGLRDKQFTYAVYKTDGKEFLFNNLNDPYQCCNLIHNTNEAERLDAYRSLMKKKMREIHDTFPDSLWYRDNWIKNRCIVETATSNNLVG